MYEFDYNDYIKTMLLTSCFNVIVFEQYNYTHDYRKTIVHPFLCFNKQEYDKQKAFFIDKILKAIGEKDVCIMIVPPNIRNNSYSFYGFYEVYWKEFKQ